MEQLNILKILTDECLNSQQFQANFTLLKEEYRKY